MHYVNSILMVGVLLATPLAAPAAEANAGAAFHRLRAALGDLGPGNDLTVKDEVRDAPGARPGLVHFRLQQTYHGLPVWGGQAILHLAPSGDDAPLADAPSTDAQITDALYRGIVLETTPNLGPAEALAVARDRIAPMGSFTDPPTADLVVWPEPPDGDPCEEPGEETEDETGVQAPVNLRLAYHVHLVLENGAAETRHEDLLVDAHTGAVLRSWSTLLTARRRPRVPAAGRPAQGQGHSRFSGDVSLDIVRTRTGYELRDPTRGGLSTRNLGGGVAGTGEPYVSLTNHFGDGQNYDPGRGPESVNGQTAAVDAQYGLSMTWDFYRNILGRNGIDGKGTPPLNLVHYAQGFDNAFWSDECFCMTYGDSATHGSFTALDVVGHEVSHGLCSTTAGLNYEGESGGLNEANSDIFGALIRFYAKGAKGEGNHIPDEAGPWTIGGDLGGTPFRYLDRPSRDGVSPDEWSPGLRRLDVHLSSGPMNRAFYFLAQGASADPQSHAYSRRLPGGMTGLGNDKAIQLWWRTLSTRLTPASGYRQARAGMLQAARELYGKGGPEEKAAALAFRAIHVGR